MSINLPLSSSVGQPSIQFNPNVQYSQFNSITQPSSLAPLQQDCFVKSKNTTNIPSENIQETETMGDIGVYYCKSSVSQIQAKIRDKKRDLEFNKRQLLSYPDNPKYGREIEKLEKEIKALEKELRNAC